jgi:hypothetical protein
LTTINTYYKSSKVTAGSLWCLKERVINSLLVAKRTTLLLLEKMKKRYLILPLIILISILCYYWLGGFKSIDKTVIDQPKVYIYGTYYEGIIGSDTLQQLFMQAREMVEKENNLRAVAIAYYGETNEETGAVKNFIGVEIGKGDLFDFPDNWELRSFSRLKSVKGCIEANVLAMPTPDDMLQELKTYAYEQSISTDSIFIEFYAGPNNLCVELLGK